MISTLTFHALQPPILSRHSVLMHPTTIMNLTDQWNFDEERDFADQGPLADMDMDSIITEVDTEMLGLMVRHTSHPTIPYCLKDDQRIGHASADTQ